MFGVVCCCLVFVVVRRLVDWSVGQSVCLSVRRLDGWLAGRSLLDAWGRFDFNFVVFVLITKPSHFFMYSANIYVLALYTCMYVCLYVCTTHVVFTYVWMSVHPSIPPVESRTDTYLFECDNKFIQNDSNTTTNNNKNNNNNKTTHRAQSIQQIHSRVNRAISNNGR